MPWADAENASVEAARGVHSLYHRLRPLLPRLQRAVPSTPARRAWVRRLLRRLLRRFLVLCPQTFPPYRLQHVRFYACIATALSLRIGPLIGLGHRRRILLATHREPGRVDGHHDRAGLPGQPDDVFEHFSTVH